MNLPEIEKKELLRLLFVSIIQEADRMNLQGIENAVFMIKKINETNSTHAQGAAQAQATGAPQQETEQQAHQ